MLDERFIYLAALVNLLGSLSYVISTLKGKTKPNKVTWFLWAILPFIAFFAEIKKSVGLPSLMTFMVGFSPLCIFIASFFNKKAHWKITRLDIICGILAIAGLFFWYLTRDGNVAILFSIVADLFAGVPTIVKSYIYPETENIHAFLAAGVSALLTLFVLKSWTFASYGFPLYIFLISSLVVILLQIRKQKAYR